MIHAEKLRMDMKMTPPPSTTQPSSTPSPLPRSCLWLQSRSYHAAILTIAYEIIIYSYHMISMNLSYMTIIHVFGKDVDSYEMMICSSSMISMGSMTHHT